MTTPEDVERRRVEPLATLARIFRVSIDALRRRFYPSGSRVIWGDGFEDDRWPMAVAVRELDACDPDEFLTPALFMQNCPWPFPTPLLRQVEDALAACLVRSNLHPRDLELTAMGYDEAVARGMRVLSFWYPTLAVRPVFLRQRADRADLRPADSTGDRPDGADAVEFLDSLLSRLNDGSVGPYDEAVAAEFTFLTGIHPSYIWPEALCSHALLTTIGWLGFLHRGRSAFMPIETAEVLLDHLGEGGLPLSSPLRGYLRDPGMQSELRRLAALRTKGKIVAIPPLGRGAAKRPTRRASTSEALPAAALAVAVSGEAI